MFILSKNAYLLWVYSSAVERLTADQQVPGSNPGVPFVFLASAGGGAQLLGS